MPDIPDQPTGVREQIEADRHWESARRRHRFFGFSLAVLTAALGWLAWTAYPAIQRHEVSIQHLPALQNAMDVLDQKMTDSDSRLTDWSKRQEDLHAQLDKTSRDLRSRIEAAGKQASNATAAMFERVQTQLDSQIDGIKTRLAGLEISRESDRAQIAELQQELGQVKTQMAEQAAQQAKDQARELAAIRGQVDQNASASNQALAGLRQKQQLDRKDFDAFTDKLAMQRVEFEVARKHSSQISPGISVGLDATDVSYQRASGWVWIMPDRHTIWLRQLKVQEPVLLNTTPDGQRRELVITRVNKNSVLGYVVVPVESGRLQTVSASAPPSGSHDGTTF